MKAGICFFGKAGLKYSSSRLLGAILYFVFFFLKFSLYLEKENIIRYLLLRAILANALFSSFG